LGLFLLPALFNTCRRSHLHAHEIKLKSFRFDPAVQIPAMDPVPGSLLDLSPVERMQGEREVLLVQWSGPVLRRHLDQLVNNDCISLLPIPDQSWLILGPAGKSALSFSRLINRAEGQWPVWHSMMNPIWKIHPHVMGMIGSPGRKNRDPMSKSPDPDAGQLYRVQLAETGGEDEVLEFIRQNCSFQEHFASFDHFMTWTIRAKAEVVSRLVRNNCVIWIEPYVPPRMHGERGALSIAGRISTGKACVEGAGGGFQEWLVGHDLSGDGVTVQVMDDGLSRGSDTNAPGTAHPDIVGKIAGIDNATGDPQGNSVAGHGHINASIIAGSPLAGGGRADIDGYLLGQGVAPGASIFATKIFNNTSSFEIIGRSFRDLVRVASQAGAMISSNSWGASVNGEYTSESQLFDSMTRDADTATTGCQEMLFLFAAGNDGPGGRSIGSPGTAKNVITVGAGENCDAGATDGCGHGANSANDIRDIASFSSRGPMADGRLGPLVFSTGTHVTGAASDDSEFDGSGVCGRRFVQVDEQPTDTKYYPAFQSDYTWSSGTSHSTPLVSGAAALLFEFFDRLNGTWPSPALVKSTLVAGADDTFGGLANTGVGDLQHVPNFDAGWGRVNLNHVLDGGVPFFLADQDTILTQSGETWKVDLQVLDPDVPLKIVIGWTDAIAAPAASTTLVNDLDLVVSKEGQTWKGNVFSDGQSVIGGEPDRLNNVEAVFLLQPDPGIYSVTIRTNLIYK
jgi:subtilisin family serine protease